MTGAQTHSSLLFSRFDLLELSKRRRYSSPPPPVGQQQRYGCDAPPTEPRDLQRSLGKGIGPVILIQQHVWRGAARPPGGVTSHSPPPPWPLCVVESTLAVLEM